MFRIIINYIFKGKTGKKFLSQISLIPQISLGIIIKDLRNQRAEGIPSGKICEICKICENQKHIKASELTFFNLAHTIFENRFYTFEENPMV